MSLPRVRTVTSGVPDFADDAPGEALLRAAPILTVGWERIDGKGDSTTRRFSFEGLSQATTIELADMMALHRGTVARSTSSHLALGAAILTAYADFSDSYPLPDNAATYVEPGVFACSGHPDTIDTLRRVLRPVLDTVAAAQLADAVKVLS